MADPKKNSAYTLRIGLIDVANRPHFKVNPTLAAGDFKVSIDGGALANLATTPVVEPSGSSIVKVSLSASEMNGDGIAIVAKDAAGNEWDDAIIYISTTDAAQVQVVTTVNAADVEIANMALSHLGIGVEINNLETDNTANGRAARRFYGTARDKTLRAFHWPFARRIASLALVESNPNDEWSYSYRYPTDCLQVRKIQSGVRNETMDSKVPYKIASDSVGLLIFTDKESAVIEYTVKADTPLTFPADFSLAFSYYLAHLMAPRLAGLGGQKAVDVGKQAFEFFKYEINDARANAFNEQTDENEPESEFIRGR